jgi:leader peptidase (prepilin peptidase)/N-methyltransferase
MMPYILVGILGACIGSFLNVVIYRVPQNLSIITPRSHCPKCHNIIPIYHNIPLMTWLFLRGKSACCKTPISIQYPFVEFMSMALFVLVFTKEGFTWNALILSMVFALLLALCVMDYYYQVIFDSVSLTTLALSFFVGDFMDSVLAILVLIGSLTLIRFYTSFFFQKETLGEGDIIIAGIMGGVLGIKEALFSLFIAALIALPFSYFSKDKNKRVPFVPFLSISILLVYYFDWMVNWYFKFIGL